MEFPRSSVITVQGGGAVAIDLIGQLQGLTGRRDDGGIPTGDQELLPAAIAGTSAGAIIATLYWAGYPPESIRGEVVRLFDASRVNTFFGRGGWLLPIRFKGFTAVAAAFSAFLRGPVALLGELVWPGRRCWFLTPLWWIWQLLSLPPRSFATLAGLVARRGIFPGDGMVAAIDDLLRKSPVLRPHAARLPPDGLLRFGDVSALRDPGTMPLFLIITDVRDANILMVSSIDPACADIPIAAAARASGGFPGFFQPMRLSNQHDACVDGGMISNFPAWVFGSNYRRSLRASGDPLLVELAYLPWLHVGLRLPESAAPSPHRFIGFVHGLFGLLTGRGRARLDDLLARALVKRRNVNPSPAPPGAAPQNVLDFSALSDPALVDAAFNRGRVNGQQAIEPDCFTLPADDEVKPILLGLAERAAFLLRDWLQPASRIRANIFVPQDAELVLAYHANMDGDPDEHIRLSRDEGITSLVYSRRATVVADLGQRKLWGPFPATDRDPYLTAAGAPAIRGDRTWLISMPLVDMTEMWPELPSAGPASSLALDMDGPVFGVLNVDAAIDYALAGAPTPAQASAHPAVLALFDVMKSAALRCSIVFNRRFLR